MEGEKAFLCYDVGTMLFLIIEEVPWKNVAY